MAEQVEASGGGRSGVGADEPVRVLIVDDHPVWRDGLRTDLERDRAGEVVGEAGDGGEAIDMARELMPDVVVMDLQLPTVSGIDATSRIVEESPHIRVLVLSAGGEEAQVLEAVKAGARGYLLKTEATAAEVVDAVRRVNSGEPVFTPTLAGLVLDEFRRIAQHETTEPGLTARETEVLRLVARGYRYREIAAQLFIATKTVQNHVQNILSKLQLNTRYELMAYAIRRGMDRGSD